MTTSAATVERRFVGNGSTTVFATGFIAIEANDLVVKKTSVAGIETTLVLNVHYSVSVTSLAVVTMFTAPASGEVLTIQRKTDLTQLTRYTASRAYDAGVLEASLDKLTYIAQELSAKLNRAYTAPIGTTPEDFEVLKEELNTLLEYIEAAKDGVATGNVTVLELTGNGTTTAYTLPFAPSAKSAVEVVVEGSTQILRDFSLSGTTLTLSEAVPSGVRFDIKVRSELPYGTVLADNVLMETNEYLGHVIYTFATRADFVNALLSPVDGAFCNAEGLAYIYEAGVTAIADLPGWLPAITIRPEHFGVDATGATNASPKIQAAIDYAASVGGADILFSGTYKIGTRLDVSNNRIGLIGDGPAVFARGIEGNPMVNISTDALGEVDDCLITGIKFLGNYPTYTAGACISVRGRRNRIINCRIEDSPGHGISFTGQTPGTYVASGTTATITLDSAYAVTVGQTVHLQFKGSVPDADYIVASVLSSTVFTVTLGGSYSESGLTANLTVCSTLDNVVQYCTITGAQGVGIAQHTAPRNRLLNNTITNCKAEGITIDNESFRCIVDGNTLINNCSPGGIGGIGSGNGDMSRIVNNYIEMSGSTGTNKPCICLGNAAGPSNNYVISGNTLIGSEKAGVRVAHDAGAAIGDFGYWTSVGIVIEGNSILNCADGVIIDAGNSYCKVKNNAGNNAASRTIVNNGTFNDVDGETDGWALRQSAALTNITGDATLVTIAYDTESQNNGDITIASGVVTVLTAGFYQISAGVKLTPGAGTTSAALQIITSASGVDFYDEAAWPSVPSFVALQAGGVQYLPAGTTIQVKVRVSGAGSKNSGVAAALQTNYFTGARLK